MQSFQFNQNLIVFADTKAVAILTINGILMGFIVPLGKVLKALSGYSFTFILLLYAFYLLVALGCCVMSAAVIYPRPHRREEEGVELFNTASIQKHFSKAEDSQAYADQFMAMNEENLVKDYAVLLHREYLISNKKYYFVKKSVFLFIVSLAFALMLFIANVFVSM